MVCSNLRPQSNYRSRRELDGGARSHLAHADLPQDFSLCSRSGPSAFSLFSLSRGGWGRSWEGAAVCAAPVESSTVARRAVPRAVDRYRPRRECGATRLIPGRQHHRAGRDICEIVVLIRRMLDHIPAVRIGATFQVEDAWRSTEIEKAGAARCQQRERARSDAAAVQRMFGAVAWHTLIVSLERMPCSASS